MLRLGTSRLNSFRRVIVNCRKLCWNACRSLQYSSPAVQTIGYNSLFPYVQKRFVNIKVALKETRCCNGCGVQLQFLDESAYGFIPKETLVKYLEEEEKPMCQRCHRLRYSRTVCNNEVPAAAPKEIIAKIPFKKHSLILCVCDVMDLPGSIIPHLNELVHNKPMIVIINKCDLLPIDTPTEQMKRWVYSLFKAHGITNIKQVFFVSSLKNAGVSSVLNYLNHTVFKHVYLVAGKSSFLNRCISFSKSKISVMSLLSLSDDGIQYNKEAMIADDHFDVDYWESESGDNENFALNRNLVSAESHMKDGVLTVSALPSTTLGVLCIKLQNARYLLYDTPGVCSSPYRIRLLTAMLSDQQKQVKILFPQKRIVPKVFSLLPGRSVLLGSLAEIDFVSENNPNPLICYSYSPLPLHLTNTDNVPELLKKHAGKLLTPPYSEDQYLSSGGIVHQSDFELKRVFNIPSEVKNTFAPSSPSSLKFTAFADISIGGFGWISLFSQGGDNTNKKYDQLLAGTLVFKAVKGFDIYPRPPLFMQIPKERRKLNQ